MFVTVPATIAAGVLGPALLAWRGVRRPGSDWAWVWATMRDAVARKTAKR
jgi:hypothetical protein